MGKIIRKVIAPTLILVGVTFINFSFTLAGAFPLERTDRKLTIVAMDRVYEFCYPEIDVYKGELYLKNAEEIVDGIYLDTIVKPKDAEVIIHPEKDYPFSFIKERYGKGIDKEDLLLKIEKALRQKVDKITAKERAVKPKMTVEKLKESTYRRSYFKTNYVYSTQERKDNISLCAQYIGGVVLYDGEEFSFNERVGERTEERGFKSAKIIEKGKFVDGIGGGVCQVSSTVYNAVLLAGLKVTERHNHSMLVSYVEPSFDAMVSSGYADLKFCNNTGAPIFLIANAVGDDIEVTVYGTKTVLEYKRVSVVKEKISPPESERVETDGLLKGEEKISVYPKFGALSEGYLEVYKNGKLQDSIKLSGDKYEPLQGVVLYGKS